MIAALFCAVLSFDPTPLYAASDSLNGGNGVVAKDEGASKRLRLIDFVSRRERGVGEPMPGEGTCAPAAPVYGNDRFSEPRHAFVDSFEELQDDAIEEARGLVADGRDEDALSLLNGLIADNDDFMEAYLERAKIYLRKGAYELAAVDLREAVSCRASSAEAHYNLGIAYEKWAEKLESTGNGAHAYEKFREAILEYKKAVWHDHGYAPAYYGLGCVCSRMGMRDDARLYFKKVVENAERDSDVARKAKYNLLLLGGY